MSGPRNKKMPARTAGLWATRFIPRLVQEEGMDASAEERIVYRIVTMRALPEEGWLNTEFMRRCIRKAQGRYQPREEIDWESL